MPDVRVQCTSRGSAAPTQQGRVWSGGVSLRAAGIVTGRYGGVGGGGGTCHAVTGAVSRGVTGAVICAELRPRHVMADRPCHCVAVVSTAPRRASHMVTGFFGDRGRPSVASRPGQGGRM